MLNQHLSLDGGNKFLSQLEFTLLMPEKRVYTLEYTPGSFFAIINIQ